MLGIYLYPLGVVQRTTEQQFTSLIFMLTVILLSKYCRLYINRYSENKVLLMNFCHLRHLEITKSRLIRKYNVNTFIQECY